MLAIVIIIDGSEKRNCEGSLLNFGDYTVFAPFLFLCRNLCLLALVLSWLQ